jgi:hypothetical protein
MVMSCLADRDQQKHFNNLMNYGLQISTFKNDNSITR